MRRFCLMLGNKEKKHLAAKSRIEIRAIRDVKGERDV